MASLTDEVGDLFFDVDGLFGLLSSSVFFATSSCFILAGFKHLQRTHFVVFGQFSYVHCGQVHL